jgi:hypothetical protein
MPEHLRAFLYVSVLALSIFWATRSAAIQIIPSTEFVRWRNTYILITIALFLTHNYWLFVLAALAISLIAARQEKYVVGLFFLLVFAAPPLYAEIPGFGLVNFLIAINQYRLMTIALLIPLAINLLQRSTTLKFGRSPVDWMVLGYFLVICALNARDATLTNWLRYILSTTIDIVVPYYVISRSLRDLDAFRHAMLGFVLGAMLLSLIGAFEAVRAWHLYAAVSQQLMERPPLSVYLFRGGLLRPNGTVENAIVLGYVIMVGFGFFLFLRHSLNKKHQILGGVLLLLGGVLLSLSRGPWVGFAVLVLLYVLQGRAALRQLTKIIAISTAAIGIALTFPLGQSFVNLLPFIGQEESFNVEYRANLLTAAMPVIERNLWTGTNNYMQAPELQAMIQGQGIIDIVNSYVGIALEFGLLGLMFFLGIWVTCLNSIRRAMRKSSALHPIYRELGRVLFATLVSIMLVIYTVSGITAIPIVYWSALALAVAYAAVVDSETKQHTHLRSNL